MKRLCLLSMLCFLSCGCTVWEDAHQATCRTWMPGYGERKPTAILDVVKANSPGPVIWGVLGVSAVEQTGEVVYQRTTAPVPKDGTVTVTTTLRPDRSVETRIETRREVPRAP